MPIVPLAAQERKNLPIATGVLDYFPQALLAVAEVSKAGNDQHHPGKPLHWDRTKSTDEADALLRHFLERGTRDVDGMRHSAKMAWRALALLQKEIEAEAKPTVVQPPKECGCTNRVSCPHDALPHPNIARGLTGLEYLTPDARYQS